jgi:hypothetical protein
MNAVVELQQLVKRRHVRAKVLRRAKPSPEFGAWAGYKVRLFCDAKKATFDYYTPAGEPPRIEQVLGSLLADEAVLLETKTFAAFVERCGLGLTKKKSRPKRVYELVKKHHRKLRPFLGRWYNEFLRVGCRLATQVQRSEVKSIKRADAVEFAGSKRPAPKKRPGQLAPTGPSA